jgi:hypothetical protein
MTETHANGLTDAAAGIDGDAGDRFVPSSRMRASA